MTNRRFSDTNPTILFLLFADRSKFFGGQQFLVPSQRFFRSNQIVKRDHTATTFEQFHLYRGGSYAVELSDTQN